MFLHLALVSQRKRNRSGRRAWSWNRCQYFFDDLLRGTLPDDMWKEHLRVNKATFQRICDVVSPQRQTNKESQMKCELYLF